MILTKTVVQENIIYIKIKVAQTKSEILYCR